MSKINWDEYKIMEGGTMTDRSFPEKGQDLKEGDSVEGKLLEIKENVGPNKSNVYVLETPEDEKVGVWGSTVIDSRLSGVKVGQEIAIEYLGMEEGKKGREYKDFKIGVKFLENEKVDVEDLGEGEESDEPTKGEFEI